MSFLERYANLNDAQKSAVDYIDGPLMVIAGPGTGKTELLSMRAANILTKTDALPDNILCLTFTESGAAAMRKRLIDIIGPEAYKISVHTFHGFGNEITNHYPEYFYNGASFQAASDITIYETLRSIFDTLSHDNPLSGMMNDEYVYLSDTRSAISELKRSGLTSDEFLHILSDNERVLDAIEQTCADIFEQRISMSIVADLTSVALTLAELPELALPPAIAPLQNVLAISLSQAIDQASVTNKTTPLTAWRTTWFEKNQAGRYVFKDRKRIKKLRALAQIYRQYIQALSEASLYDFDDMVLQVVHALEVIDELRFALQEKYLYIMVDEFQDTNLAQNRLLTSLANNPASEGAPNLMVVGDDDQAIYSFQGAEMSNMQQFRSLYETTSLITLTENYRSRSAILEASRQVITLGTNRLENSDPDLNKTLHPNRSGAGKVTLTSYDTSADERAGIARSIHQRIKEGTSPSSIAVIARRHHELVGLLPFFSREEIGVNYERRDNVLESEIIVQVELLARIVQAIAIGEHDVANSLLPELLAHPAWGISPTELWHISFNASAEKKQWMQHLEEYEQYKPLHTWLCQQAADCSTVPLEQLLDQLIGTSASEHASYHSPLYEFYFNDTELETNPEQYMRLLEALRTIRDHLREHAGHSKLYLSDFLDYIELHKSLGSVITSINARSEASDDRVHFLTAHKSKGLEFDHVYVVGAVDSAWGEKVRGKSRLLSYPENLPLSPAGDSYDERLRLFFVAMTRAKDSLSISYASANDLAKTLLPASFLSATTIEPVAAPAPSLDDQLSIVKLQWHSAATALPRDSAVEILRPSLESYKLSATHLGTFLDISRGGPDLFLRRNLLRFPEAIGPNAAYGSCVHRTLQSAHSHLSATGKRKPVEDLLQEFETELRATPLSERDMNTFLKRGVDYLQGFLTAHYDSFHPAQRAEFNFSRQDSFVGEAHLTGSLDLMDIDTETKTITVTDYKTGKPSSSWQGKTDLEKIKLHKYRQQLLFYKLLVEHSRDYGRYTVEKGMIQYVEPDTDGQFHQLDIDFDSDELERCRALIEAVWRRIVTFELPSIDTFSADYKGMLAFEDWLLENS